MKKLSAILMASVAVAVVAVAAQAAPGENGNGHRVAVFIDENGDGFNDLAPDADGDGIPNGLDPDWRRSKAHRVRRGRQLPQLHIRNDRRNAPRCCRCAGPLPLAGG